MQRPPASPRRHPHTVPLPGKNSGSFALPVPTVPPGNSFRMLLERFCHLTLLQAAPLSCCGPSHLSCPQHRCSCINLQLWLGYEVIPCGCCPVEQHITASHSSEHISVGGQHWLLQTFIIFFPKPPLAIKFTEMLKVSPIFLVVTVLPSCPITSTKSPTWDSLGLMFTVSL